MRIRSERIISNVETAGCEVTRIGNLDRLPLIRSVLSFSTCVLFFLFPLSFFFFFLMGLHEQKLRKYFIFPATACCWLFPYVGEKWNCVTTRIFGSYQTSPPLLIPIIRLSWFVPHDIERHRMKKKNRLRKTSRSFMFLFVRVSINVIFRDWIIPLLLLLSINNKNVLQEWSIKLQS